MNDSKQNILVVDDDPDILLLFKRLFTGKGYQVTTASNGQEALEVFKVNPPKVALVDLKLPGIDGVKLSRKIKEINKLTEVILISGYSTMDSAINSVKLGAFDYFCKPFKLEEVTKSVERALEKFQSINPHEHPLFDNLEKMQIQQKEIQSRLDKFQLKYLEVINNSPDGILELNSQGKIMKINPVVAKLTGYHSDELQQLSICELFTDLTNPAEFLTTVKKLGEIRDWEISLATKSGKSKVFKVSVWTSQEQEESIFRMLLRDVTDQKQLSDKLLQSQKLAGLGQVAAGIVHELKNPLTIISASAQFCLEHCALDADIEEHFSAIYSNVKNANRIISELLHFARPIETNFTSEEMNSILAETMKLVKPEMEQRQIRVLRSFANQKLPIKCDPKQLQQVLVNLMLNAFQASSSGNVVTLGSDFDEEKQMIRVEIIDSGVGIPSEHLSKIFEPFFTLKKGGTGLGLSICQHIMLMHQGRITVESKLGVGTRFSILLPPAPAFNSDC